MLVLLLVLLTLLRQFNAIEITESIGTNVNDRTGGYEVFINGKLWFRSNGTVSLRANNTLYSTEDRTLRLKNITKTQGTDNLSFYTTHTFDYGKPGEDDILLKASMKLSDGKVYFQQLFPQQLEQTSAGNADELISSFPSFEISREDGTRGYAHWVSWYYDDPEHEEDASHRKLLKAPGFSTPTYGEWGSEMILAGGIGGTGVTCVYDQVSSDSVVLSAFENPMVVSHVSTSPGRLQYGIMGNVSSIPANFSVTTVLSVSGSGVNHAVRNWGKNLRTHYGKQSLDVSRAMDVTLQYLGYTTDNGAYYYYNTEPGQDYGETLVGVKQYADKVGLPYKYVLLDSWWYYKGENNGVTNWTAMPDIFPEGIESLYQQTGWLVQAHNRYWSYENVYASQNGGDFKFIEDAQYPQGAVPVDKTFWTSLLKPGAQHWALRVYEQDWLYNEFYVYVSQMLTSVSLGRDWLLQMGQGAASQGLVVQYCMPYIRHLIQSVEVPAVTQARASDDYVVAPYDGVANWKIAAQSLLIFSLGLAPSKDGYWSTSYQPGNPYGEERYEPYARLQAAVTALSTGPVAIGDGIGHSDVPLVMRSCMQNGRLLQPSFPATPIDASFKQAVFAGQGPDGEVWFAPSVIGLERNESEHEGQGTAMQLFGELLVAELRTPWSIVPSDLGCYDEGELNRLGHRLCYNRHDFYVREANSSFADALRWSNSAPLELQACGSDDFQLWSVSQVDKKTGWSFLGEANKWVGVSPTRFHSVRVSEDGMRMTVIASSGATSAYGGAGGSTVMDAATMRYRQEQDKLFFGTVDEQEEVVVGFVNPQGEVVSASCSIPSGQRGDMRKVLITSDGDCKTPD